MYVKLYLESVSCGCGCELHTVQAQAAVAVTVDLASYGSEVGKEQSSGDPNQFQIQTVQEQLQKYKCNRYSIL